MYPELTLSPIGYLRSGQRVKFDARHQPSEGESGTNNVELVPDPHLHRGLQDLAGFTRIWLVWWFHKNRTWRPLVLPPRGPARRRGVFATRSPHRPNPVGLTPVRLLAVEVGRLVIGPCDLLDGTPILDIKPYIPEYDSFAGETSGWMSEAAAWGARPAGFSVKLSDLAKAQCDWLRDDWSVDFQPRMFEMLGRDPTPHRTRRIRARPDGRGEIACGAWRGIFVLQGEEVTVESIESGYPVRFLEDRRRKSVPDREAQIAFRVRWGQTE